MALNLGRSISIKGARVFYPNNGYNMDKKTIEHLKSSLGKKFHLKARFKRYCWTLTWTKAFTTTLLTFSCLVATQMRS